jgi:hypothetical protein
MHCPGMFLPVINLLSKYDPVLQNLLENRTKKSVTYLSPNIQNEVINLLANSVQQELVNKINASSFYSIIIDSTQDISKVDQLSLIFRYVEIVHSNNVVTEIIINESFLGFVPVENQSADTISNKIISSLNNLNISINKLCGQGYDGAANMSGIYNGVQEKISKKVENAPYVHCAAHNLNLILNDAVKNVETEFFLIVEKIYTYFGNSILRWGLLYPDKGIKNIKLKKLVPTRWSSRHDALHAMRYKYSDILKTLTKIILTSKLKAEIDEAKALKKHWKHMKR